MRISMLVLNNLTHDARVQKEAKTLAQAGYQVTVFALQKGAVPPSEQRDGYQVFRIHLGSDRWKPGPFSQFFRYFEFTFRAAQQIKRSRANVCHAHAVQALPACWLATRNTHSRLVYDAHEFEQGRDFATALRIPWLMQKFWALPETLFIRSADAVITVSDSIAEALVRSYRLPRPVVVRNSPEEFTRPDRSTYLNDKHSIPLNLPIIIYQGGLNKGRGLPELVHSAALIPNAAIVIVGDGPLAADLHNIARQLGDQARLVFTGRLPLEDLPAITASASLGAVLTQNTCLNHYYTLPNKIFEYLQAGLPVIGSNMPEIARIIHDHQVGQVIEQISAESIADGVQRLLTDPDSYRKMVDNARQAARKLNWGVESRKLLALYNDLA